MARQPADRARVEEEMGDLLFALANLCRKLQIEPEAALRRANDKFAGRFAAMEGRTAAHGRRLAELTPEELDAAWEAVKAGGVRPLPGV